MQNLTRTSLLLVFTSLVSTAVYAGGPVEDVVPEVGRTRWTTNNRIRLLVYPRESWEARLELLERAQHHIFISTFSWHDDFYGRRLAERLAEVVAERRRSNPDFTAYCMIDATAMGTFNRFSRTFKKLRDSGAVVRAFNTATSTTTPLWDGRMHDKMLIVDGRWALVSGRNIAEEYFDPHQWWLDLGLLVEGEAVWDLQMHYLKAWEAAVDLGKTARIFWPEEKIRRRIRTFWSTGRFPGGLSPLDRYLTPEFFPSAAEVMGARTVAVLYDNNLVWPRAPSTDLLTELVRGAENEIDLMTPFPNLVEELTREIESAANRGVRVRLFVNSEDAAIRRGPFWLAGIPTLIRVLEAGGEVWVWSGDGQLRKELEAAECSPPLLPPTALHGKLARIDDRLAMVHSSNFNIRSTFYNTEAGIVVLDKSFNREVEELLDRLVTLRDARLSCSGGLGDIRVEEVVHRLTTEDLPRLRRILGSKQRFLDSMAVLW
jgi:cardiolipin synthase